MSRMALHLRPFISCATAPADVPAGLARGMPLALVCTAHAAVLWWLTIAWARTPVLTTPPAMVGMLVSAPMPAPVVTPSKPLPMAPAPRPKPKPVDRPKPLPALPDAPASERAVTAPLPDPKQVSAAPAAPAPEATTPPQPVTPPHSDAAHLNNPAPVYPALSRRLREQGRVLLDVYILADGSVGQLRLKRSSGYPRLDEAALDAVRRWRYIPARRGEEAIPYWYVQPLHFDLTP